jgi:HYR domain
VAARLLLLVCVLIACTVPQASARVLVLPGDFSFEATGPDGAIVPYDNAGLSCSPGPGSAFPLGPTTVSCVDPGTGAAAGSFTVTVVDTTAPTVTPPENVTLTTGSPDGATITYGPASASDLVKGSLTPSCSPASGSTFTVGTTTVTCSASDGTNTGTATFTVTVNYVEATPPTVSVPGSMTVEATGPSGASVEFSVTASDSNDPSPTVSCDHTSGQGFPLGTTPVTCTASDAAGNTSAPATFNITVVDTTPPVVTPPPNVSMDTEEPSGTAVTYPAATATDAVAGSIAASCSPPSGAEFGLGDTAVTCSASDGHNTGTATFTVSVRLVDKTPPQLTNMPADITAEANSPTGSKVNYSTPTAVDLVDGPMPNVGCTPDSGSTFPLGVDTVTCSSSDSRGNRGSATFTIRIVDTTPPVLIPPGDTSVYATTDSGSYALDQGPILAFVQGAHASDIADPHPVVTSDHPDFFAVGTTTVTFTARDASGNVASATAKLTVLPKPAQGTTPPLLPPSRDNKPPANVTGVTAKSGDARVTLTWTNPTDSDFDHTEISRTTQTGFKATGTVVYRGTGTSFTNRGLRNGVEYRYVIATVDKTGNASAGVATVVMPKANLLRTPADGARLKKVPQQFRWKADPRAGYYNLQLYSGGTLVAETTASTGQKILSVFPTKAVYNFKSPWKWQGRKYRMTNGLYTWYVWPGYGAREDVNYGPLMGSATFQVTRAKSR